MRPPFWHPARELAAARAFDPATLRVVRRGYAVAAIRGEPSNAVALAWRDDARRWVPVGTYRGARFGILPDHQGLGLGDHLAKFTERRRSAPRARALRAVMSIRNPGHTPGEKAKALAGLFVRERAKFARKYPAAKGCALAVETAPCVSPDRCELRALAYALPYADPPLIVVHFRLLHAPRATQLGILRHELGHLCDPTPDARGGEQRADDIAAAVTRHRIRYDAADVQTVGPGRYPRPRHLPR